MTAASKQTLPAPAPPQAELDRIRFVKATGKCSSLHLADGKTGVCDRLWEMRAATEDELKALAGKHCKVCLGRLTRPTAPPMPKAAAKATTPTRQVENTVKVTQTEPAAKNDPVASEKARVDENLAAARRPAKAAEAAEAVAA